MKINKNNSKHKINEEKQLRYFLTDLLDRNKTELRNKQRELSLEVTKNLNLDRSFKDKLQENIFLEEYNKISENESREMKELLFNLDKEKQRAKILTPDVINTKRIQHDMILPFLGYLGIIEQLEQKNNFESDDIKHFLKLNTDFEILNIEINKIISLNQNYDESKVKNNER